MNFDSEFEKLLKKAEKPARYIGGEINEIRKDLSGPMLRFGFAFPDMYEIGMSYLGLQVLYNILNKRKSTYCERIFAPAPDMESLMRERGFPLFTLETKTSVKELDIIGFTLQYELSYTNILNMLSLADIPFMSKDRGEGLPFIVGGGPCAFNPEPLADIFDIFIIGDGEEDIIKLCEVYEEWKAAGKSRNDFLKMACSIESVYVPAFYEPVYNRDGSIGEIKKLYDKAADRVKKCIIQDINKADFPENNIVPLIEIVHDRAVVEAFRGCTRGCRFCQAGMVYRPVRERTKENIIRITKNQIKATGHEELSLLSLSTSDYSEFEPLVTELMEICGADDVSLSLPSLRLDSFSLKALEEISGYKKPGLTFAPEAGSPRLRNVINKSITDEDILNATGHAAERGWSPIKLYFMIGLPTETREDLDGIAHTVKRIMDVCGRRRIKITVSVSNFVPKAHTPFQWEAQNSREEFTEKIYYLKEKLKIRGVAFNYHDSGASILEAVFARGDRRLTAALVRAWEKGCKFDGWSEHFNYGLWNEAFSETGTDMAFYASRRRDYGELLPWDIIDCSVSKEFLMAENEKAKGAEATADCRFGCGNCGINERVICEFKRASCTGAEDKDERTGAASI